MNPIKPHTVQFRAPRLWLAAALVAMTALTLRAETRTWAGPANGDWFTAANWLPEGAGNNYPQPDDTVIVTNGSILLTNGTAELAAFSLTNATVTFTNWTTALRATQVTLWNNGNLTHARVNTNTAPGSTNRVWLVCSDLVVNVGGKINVDERGYERNQGPGKGSHSGSGIGSGAGHGGAGGVYWYYATPAGIAYGSSNAPVTPGSGGGGGSDASPSGGRGGGVVRIEATGTITLNGSISADGGVGAAGSWSYAGGGGAGGSIYLTCFTFEGVASGVLRARGAAGGYSTEGGGGGRIAVAYTNPGVSQAMTFDTRPGSTNIVFDWQYGPQWGTLHLSDTRLLPSVIDSRFSYVRFFVPQQPATWAPGSLIVSNGCIEFQNGFVLGITNEVRVTATNSRLVVAGGSLTCGTHLTLDQGGRLFLKNRFAVHCGGDLLVTNPSSAIFAYGGPTNGLAVDYGGLVSVTGRMTVAPGGRVYPFSDQTDGGSVLFRMNDLQIRTNGGFNATGRGYIHRNAAGPGTGKTTSNYIGSGGGYGGKGGSSYYATGGTNYGSIYAPIAPGSGGGGRDTGQYNLYAGGGAVRIEARGKITIDGSIAADGSSGGDAGGGSGGGIYLISETLEGGVLGAIQAKGGTGNTIGGGGGGGRVAVWIGLSAAEKALALAGDVSSLVVSATNKDFLGTLSVTNGTGYTNLPPSGAATGTLVFIISTAIPLAVQSQPATNITATGAMVSGSISGSKKADVYFCWGYTNAGTNSLMDWDHYSLQATNWDVGPAFSTNLTGLLSGSSYVYRCFASNSVGTAWSMTQSFTTVFLPTVENLGSLDTEAVNTLRGRVTVDGGDTPTCWFYYWADTSASTSVVAMGTQTLSVTFSTNLVLLPAGTYQYRILASNLAGGAWSTISNFTVEAYTPRTRTWVGPSNGDWFAAANWLPEGAGNNYPQPGDTVIVTNGSILLTNGTAELAAFSLTNATVTFTNWTTALRATQVTLWNNGNLTHAGINTNTAPGSTNRVWLVCSDLVVNVGGKINVDERGYERNQGPGKGSHAGVGIGSGAGHGGAGGVYWYLATPAGIEYGSSNAPVTPGSGGGGGSDASPSGGRGGGVVRIEATGTITLNGSISANGGVGTTDTKVPAWDYVGGGGAGGSIYLTCVTFEGAASGVLRARGAAGGFSADTAGGGGRIAVDYTQLGVSQAMTFDTRPGFTNIVFGWQEGPQWGTLHLSDTRLLPSVIDSRFSYVRFFVPQQPATWAPGSLIVSNGCIEFQNGFVLGITNEVRITATNSRLVVAGGSLTCGTHLTLDQGGRLFLKNRFAVHCGGDLLVTNPSSALFAYGGPTNGLAVDYGGLVSVTGRMTVAPGGWVYPFSDQTDGGSVLFRMNDLQIRTNGGFNATGRGYIHRNSAGPGAGKTTSSYIGSGGGYGGKGGSSYYATGGTNYGSIYAPIAPGSGGGGRDTGQYNLYAGGGAVRIEARGKITIDGSIAADGSSGGDAGGGSGGGIYLISETLEGGVLGAIQAKGGNGNASPGGGGGGGRIAVWIGLSDVDKDRVWAGVVDRVTVTNVHRYFLGTFSVTNGTGYTNLPPGGAESGTIRVITPLLNQGTLFLMR